MKYSIELTYDEIEQLISSLENDLRHYQRLVGSRYRKYQQFFRFHVDDAKEYYFDYISDIRKYNSEMNKISNLIDAIKRWQ